MRILKELIQYGNNIKEKTKVTLSEIKKNLQGTNSEGKEAGIEINDLEHKEEKSIQSEQQEEKRILKYEDKLAASGTSSNIRTSELQGCQKQKRKSKKLKTYLK